jgi:ferredoxin
MNYKIDIKDLRKLYEKIGECYTIVSPIEENGVILYKENSDFDKLPFGRFQLEYAGSYFLTDKPEKHFSYVRPYNSPKNFLRPSQETLIKVYKKDGKLSFEKEDSVKHIAFFDVRKCDLKAISILDDIYVNKNDYLDENYKNLRKDVLIVAVNCNNVSNVCFCNSMKVDFNNDYAADIVLTEIEKEFLLEVKTKKGEEIVSHLHFNEATEKDLEKKREVLIQTTNQIQKKLDTENIKEILYQKIEHQYWEEIGSRCLSCTNCTQVCPTCFCFDIIEKNSLDGSYSERVRIYDSCFNPNFATVHKFNLRDKISLRYRQWLLHKFAYWQDQFGDFGCVGCGRCITWCPAKIDIQMETQKLREV